MNTLFLMMNSKQQCVSGLEPFCFFFQKWSPLTKRKWFFWPYVQVEGNQVMSWIRNGESMLSATLSLPSTLLEAEQLRNEHSHFQVGLSFFFSLGFVARLGNDWAIDSFQCSRIRLYHPPWMIEPLVSNSSSKCQLYCENDQIR